MGDHGLKQAGDIWEVGDSKGKELIAKNLVKEVSEKETPKQDKEVKQTKEDKQATGKSTK